MGKDWQHGKIGLLVGADRPLETGMPTATGLTKELMAWLTPQKLVALNSSWRQQGGGYSDEVIRAFNYDPYGHGVTYATTLRSLEVRFRQLGDSPLGREFHGLYSWLVEVVYRFLYLRIVLHEESIKRRLPFLDGIADLAAKNSPLWVFSSRNCDRKLRSGERRPRGDERRCGRKN